MADWLPDGFESMPPPRCRCSLTPMLPPEPEPAANLAAIEQHPDLAELAQFAARFYEIGEEMPDD